MSKHVSEYPYGCFLRMIKFSVTEARICGGVSAPLANIRKPLLVWWSPEIVSLCTLTWLQKFLKSVWLYKCCIATCASRKREVFRRAGKPVPWFSHAGPVELLDTMALHQNYCSCFLELGRELVFLQFFSRTSCLLRVCALFHHSLLFFLSSACPCL